MQRHDIDAVSSYILPYCPDFLSNQFKLTLTEGSKKLFDRGSFGQGYLGIVDLTSGHIHLIPAFNKGDGFSRTDKDGNPFEKGNFVLSDVVRGAVAPIFSAHSKALKALGLLDKLGQGVFIGFGLWKGSIPVRILESQYADHDNVPNEFQLIQDKNTKQWKLIYVDESYQSTQIPLENVPGLTDILASLKNNSPISIAKQEREAITKAIYEWKSPSHTLPIKLLKNRSTSLNQTACQYDPLFQWYFRVNVRDHQDHIKQLERELPQQVMAKIMQTVCKELYLTINQDDIIHPSVRAHWDHQKNWERFGIIFNLKAAINQLYEYDEKHQCDRFDVAKRKALWEDLWNHRKEWQLDEKTKNHPEILLMAAIALNDMAGAKELLRSKEINFRDNNNSRLFQLISEFTIQKGGSVEMLSLFLDQGADPNFKDENQISLLEKAALSKRPDIIEILKKRNADYDEKSIIVLLAPENHQLIDQNKMYSDAITKALLRLNQAGILSTENRKFIAQHLDNLDQMCE